MPVTLVGQSLVNGNKLKTPPNGAIDGDYTAFWVNVYRIFVQEFSLERVCI
jgi:hypothetical protein